VNIKILLDAIVAEGDLTKKQRNELLVEMTESVARLDFTDVGPRTIEAPEDPSIVALDEVRDVYDRLVGGS